MATLTSHPEPTLVAASTNIGHALVFENATEQREPITLHVRGRIPPWLTGSLYRTGPGTFRVASGSARGHSVNIRHWFDGLGLTHRFEIMPDGSVQYRNHSTAEGLQSRISRAGTIPTVTFGVQDPCETLFSKFFTLFKPNTEAPRRAGKCAPDEANISVTLTPNMPGIAAHHSASTTPSLRNLVAKSDQNALQILHPETLDPLRVMTYTQLDPRLDGQISAAHSCHDPTTGEFFNFTLKLGPSPTYKVFRIRPEDGKPPQTKGHTVDILAEIRDAPAAYLHSFAMTQKYVVLCVWQADFSYYGISVGLNRNLAGSFKKWDPKRDTLFYVIDRNDGGVVAKFNAPPFFNFHKLNSYDSGADDIVIDLAVYDTHSVIDLLYLDKLRNLDENIYARLTRARRYVLKDVGQNKGHIRPAEIEFTLAHELNIELPTIHPALYYKPYRYAYGINKADPTVQSFADRIIKLDMFDLTAKPKLWGAPGYVPGEPIFIPRPGSNPRGGEDEGVVLSVVLDADAQKSMLVILNAKDLKEEARAEMQTHVPMGFHGAWVKRAK
ncbi:carotenoid oxygenase [Sparassis latifolia]